MDEKEQPIDHWLNSGELGNLFRHLAQIEALNAALKPLLPETFREGCRVENIEQGCVILAVKNASIVTLLRYELPQLLNQLRQDPRWAGLASIKCKVNTTHR